MGNQILELRQVLSAKLEPMRYEHSLSVSFMCTALAMRYGYDLEKAELAGLLHDCAKQYNDQSILKKCEKEKIALTDDQKKAPSILHAIYGKWLVQNKYNIKDPEILEAISWHTTGKPQMALLEEILYVADYIEPRRYKAADLPRLRKLAFVNLEDTVYHILHNSLAYLREKKCFINPMSDKAYEYYKTLYEEKGE